MPASLRSSRQWFIFALWLALFFGLYCRFYGLNWDQGAIIHPDERFVTGLVPRISWPSSFGEWFDSTKSPLNPKNLKGVSYVYGQLPLMIAKVAIGSESDIAKVLVRMRALSGFFDCLTVLFSLLIGRRLLGKNWGLFVGALVSLTALNIQQSHYFTTDNFATTFMTLAFWSGVRWVDTKKWFDALGLGIWFGCSLACKLSSAFFAVAWLGLVILAWRRHGFKAVLPLAVCSFLLAFWTFRTFHPMMFLGVKGPLDIRLDPRFLARGDGEWVGDFGQQLGITNGIVDVPFNVQWIGRTKWLFSLVNLGWWGFGWPMLLAGLAGGLWAIRRPRQFPVFVVAMLFVLVSIGVQGAQFSRFTRYYLPLTPMFALLAALFWRQLLVSKPKLRPLVPLALAYSLLWCASVTAIYGRPLTRLAASQWIVDNLLSGTVVVDETSWDEGLPISWVPPGVDTTIKEYTDPTDPEHRPTKMESYDLDWEARDPAPAGSHGMTRKKARIEDALNKAEWIFISSGRSWQTIPRWPQKWPMMTAFYRALFDGKLGFEKAQEFTSYPGLGPFRFPDDGLEEALSVYDHPRVLLFHKRSDYSPEKVAAVLDSVALPSTDQFHPRDAPGQWDSLPQPPSSPASETDVILSGRKTGPNPTPTP